MKSVLQAGWLLTTAFGNLIVVIIAEAKFFDSQVCSYILISLRWMPNIEVTYTNSKNNTVLDGHESMYYYIIMQVTNKMQLYRLIYYS